MTDHRDYSADCFTGNHAACRFRGCDCACHRPDEMFTEPAPYKAVPAYRDSPDQPKE